MTGPEKVVVFLGLVGEEVAGELVAQLAPNELLQLRGLGKAGVIAHGDITEVFNDLTEKAANAGLSLDSSSDYLCTGLTKEHWTEEAILTGLEAEDAELAEQVRAEMLTFEDLQTVDDQSLQTLARRIDRDQWAVALRTASTRLKETLFRNMSERATDLLKEDMDAVGPVRLSVVEAAQKAILETATALEEAGTIQLRSRTNDSLV